MPLKCVAVLKELFGARVDFWHQGPLRLLLMAVIVTCMLSPAVYGQMGQYSVYSDQWVDTSDPEALTIVGSGVTQDYQNYYGHTYWTVTQVTSPSGRTATSTSSQSSSYAHTETRLPWDWAEPGTYSAQTQHWLCCPYMGGNPYTGQGCYPSSSTSANRLYGVSHAQYYRDTINGDGTGRFVPIAGCNVTCMPSSINRPLVCENQPSEYTVRLQLWVNQGLFRVCIIGIHYSVPINCTQELGQCYESET
jgi:hypothetical protein